MSAGAGRAVIVGGGVIGTACAYYLVRAGWRVTIVDRSGFGQGCSLANCGLVCPSHILPVGEPGMVSQAVRSLFQRNSPFAIRPRFDLALWAWLAQFARRCNERDMLESARGIQPLLESSLVLYRELIEREALDCEWEQKGLLFPYRSKAALEAYAATDRLLSESFHCPARQLDSAELTQLEPALCDGLAGGWYYHDDAQVRPDRLLTAWRAVLERAGVEIVENCTFDGFRAENGRARAVETSGGALDADSFVIATGAWTPQLNRHLGCRVPIQPGKGYSLTMPRPDICPAIPLIFPETRVAVTPFHSGYRLGSTMEFAGYDSTINPDRLNLLRKGAEPYLREPYREPIEHTWFGWRPMTYDGLPIIDRTPALANVLIAAGHNMLGLSMAPATGKLVANLLCDKRPELDPAPYRLGRFSK